MTNGLPVAIFPGILDNANFTNSQTYTINWTANVTNANVFVNSRGGIITQSLASSTWWITNNYILGQTANRTGNVVISSGTLVVTNGSRNAALTVGGAGRGNLTIAGGTVIADQLFATNIAGQTNSIDFQSGTLTTYGASMRSNFTMNVGTAAGSATWNVLGGTNTYIGDGSHFFNIGNGTGSTGLVMVSGAGTRLVVTNETQWWTGFLTLGNAANSSGNQLLITNGGVVAGGYGRMGMNSTSSNNLWVVTDSGSRFDSIGDFDIMGESNIVRILNGGYMSSAMLNEGSNSYSHGNTVLVSGSGSLWDNTEAFRIGWLGSYNTMMVSNGAIVNATQYGSSLGIGSGSDSNTVIVTGSGSRWNENSIEGFGVGYGGSVNTLKVLNGAQFYVWGSADLMLGITGVSSNNALFVSGGSLLVSSNTYIGSNATSTGNSAWISDVGTTLLNSNDTMIGYGGSNNKLVISNGAKVVTGSGGTLGALVGSVGNSVILTDTGSTWTIQGWQLYVGNDGGSNTVRVLNGATLISTGGETFLGWNAIATGNVVSVSGRGSTMTNNTIYVGYSSRNANFTVSNGGSVYATNILVGTFGTASNNTLLVDGAGSILQNIGALFVGSNATSLGWGRVMVQNEGTIEDNMLVSGLRSSGDITNSGGIFQFTTATPTITTNTLNSIIVTNATVSYRNVAAADIFNTQVSNMTFRGNNTFRLNNSTNSTITSYQFGTNNSPLYQNLSLINGSTRWQSTAFTMGLGGTFFISNTAATVAGTFTNNGTVNVYGGSVRFENPVVLSGAYLSDPSTNIFATNVVITSTGYIQAAPGDIYQFERNWTIQSTQSNLFDMISATVLFTNFGGQHVLDLTGSSALDRGTNGIVQLSQVTNNFALGTLIIAGAGDTLRVTGAVNNALYVGTLALGSLANTNNLFTDVNVYYDANLAGNSYLSRTTYDLPGGGMLIPYGAPEPGAILLLTFGMAGLLRRRFKKQEVS